MAMRNSNFRFSNFVRQVYRFTPVFDSNRLDHRVPEAEAVQNIYRLMGFMQFEICRFLDFDRPVNRFLAVFDENRLDHRVPEVEAVQNIYTLRGF